MNHNRYLNTIDAGGQNKKGNQYNFGASNKGYNETGRSKNSKRDRTESFNSSEDYESKKKPIKDKKR